MTGTLRRRVLDVVDRRVGRRFAAGLGSLYLSARARERCAVRYDRGQWIHRYRDGVVVDRSLGGPSPAVQDRYGADIFLFGYRPRPGDTVLDIGAGVGGEARLFSQLVGPSGRVVCVEAHPVTFRCLERTIELNGLDNVTAVECAVTGENGVVRIDDDPVAHIGNGLSTTGEGVEVVGRTLRDVLDSVGVERVDLLKMNIEGAELPVLAASVDILHRVERLVVSCHDFLGSAAENPAVRTFEPVLRLLRDAGFDVRTRPADHRPWVRFYIYAARRP